MNISHLLLFCAIFTALLLGKNSIAQTEEGPYFETANIFHQQASIASCKFVQTAIERIRNMDEDSLRTELITDAENLEQFNTNLKDDPLRDDFELLKDRFRLVSRHQDPRSFLIKGLDNLCKNTAWPLIYLLRKAALSNSAILNTLASPFTNFVSFWSGFFSRKKTELGPRRDFIYRAFGPSKNTQRYVLGLLGSELSNFLLGTNPATAIINASVGLEMLTNYRCYHVNNEDLNQSRFCNTYGHLRDFFHQGNQRSFSLGKRVQQQMDNRIRQRRKNFPGDIFCAFAKTRQVKVARRVLQRHQELSKDPRINSIHIILPIQKNTCTKILMYSGTDQHLNELEREIDYLEGIKVVHYKRDVFPNEYYFSTEDLKKMTFEDSLCYEAESIYYGRFITSKFSSLHDLLKSSLAVSVLSLPSHIKIPIDDKLIHQGSVTGLKNIIFSIGPNQAEAVNARKMEAEKTIIIRRIKRDYTKTLKSGSYGSCKRLLARREVDLLQFERDLKRITEIAQQKSLQKLIEFEIIEKQYRKSQKRLQLSWELRQTNSLQDITSALRSRQVGNIIIISHGKDSGHLVDVLEQELPREAFTDISPSIQSLNFYSCYSKKLVGLYNLEEKIKTLPSFYKIRYTSNVSENDFMGGDNLAPMAGFGYFLSRLDTFLSNASRGASLLQASFGNQMLNYHAPKKCLLDSSNVVIQKGSYAITLNDNLVGTIDASNKHGNIVFPCDFLKDKNNNLKVKNIMNAGGSVIENLNNFFLQVGDLVLDETHSVFRKNSLAIFKFDLVR